MNRAGREQQPPSPGAGAQAPPALSPGAGHPQRPRTPSGAGQFYDFGITPQGWYPPPVMAKAKRRKRAARRSKANHGRRPNAGRG
ncbi:MAG: hypothetical protein FJW79_05255 [Actinobacteria bacterium]|nr:hypothetical protein [Actinomycetota bacterium]